MANGRHPGLRIQMGLKAVLPEGLKVAIHPRESLSPAFNVSVLAGTGEHRFVVGWSAQGWPADVSRLTLLSPDLDVVFAPDLSPGARDWLTDHNLGWVDEAGRANVCLRSGLVIFREPPERQSRRELPTKWTRATVAVAEAALAGITPTVEATERATGLSRGATANALAQLERLGFLKRPSSQRGPGSARRIVDQSRLLNEYTVAVKALRAREPTVLVHSLLRDPIADLSTKIGPALDSEGIDWAVTGAAASAILAPYLSDITVLQLYVRNDVFRDPKRLATVLGGRAVERGHRIEIREAPTKLTTKGPVIENIHVALPIRVYADLLADGGRSAEAAHHLKETLHVGADTQSPGP